MRPAAPNDTPAAGPRLDSLSHGGGCKVAPGLLSAVPRGTTRMPVPDGLLDGVQAITDVTGFGAAGHALDLARGAKLDVFRRRGFEAAAEAGEVQAAPGAPRLLVA